MRQLSNVRVKHVPTVQHIENQMHCVYVLRTDGDVTNGTNDKCGYSKGQTLWHFHDAFHHTWWQGITTMPSISIAIQISGWTKWWGFIPYADHSAYIIYICMKVERNDCLVRCFNSAIELRAFAALRCCCRFRLARIIKENVS
jgi:hypothetical protein